MKRREFIILGSVGAASASLLSACGHPEEKLIPAFIPDDEYVPGIDYWKASTCGMCPAGCGIIVRTREHKANKIEGNPLHPVNRGALCARGQAGLEVLYNPDRIKGPMKRVGERGEGKWEEIGWDEGIELLAQKLREIKAHGLPQNIAFATTDSRGVTGLAASLLSRVLSPRMFLLSEGLNRGFELDAANYGRYVTPIFDIAKATYLISFGARFLETWLSPVKYSLAYAEFRGIKGKARGRFVQVEPRMSLTAANADEWLPIRPGAEGLMALAIAQVIVSDGLRKNIAAPKFLSEPIDNYAPERVANKIDIPAQSIIRIAHEFAVADRPIAIGGGSAVATADGRSNMMAINYLNVLAGNLHMEGGVLLPKVDDFDPFSSLRTGSGFWPDLEHTMTRPGIGGLSALLIHQTNPVYALPRAADEIRKIPFIASFSTFMDESTVLADLILPDCSYLESWDIKATPIDETRIAVNVSQPVVKLDLNARQTADVLIKLCREIGAADFSFPYENTEELVKKTIEKLATPSPETTADSILEKGTLITEVQEKSKEPALYEPFRTFTEASVDDAYQLTLIAYAHAGLGERANLPSLQELPDPMTAVMWGSWVEINPRTAASLGIADGDLVVVSSQHGTIQAPAVLFPGIRPDTVAMPFGQGHTAFGRYAKDIGSNVTELNPYLSEPQIRLNAIRVNVKPTGRQGGLIRFGTELQERMERNR
jgi:anaerobic selenocysteine-containing dehydrogenase